MKQNRTYSMSPDLIEYLKTREQQKGVNQSRTVREALRQFMKSNPNKVK